ncbi:FAD-dependent monooxygenase [Nocardia pseudovaccinii]|uniref:FAD-dependent monooxygenase n=1 Tax=Nocardia pseudovaccinii TaxID=189540 RepID=UPI003D9023FD
MGRTKAIVLGAGIGGLTTAAALRRAGIGVEIFEAAPQQRKTGTGLGLASNATAVLDALGIEFGSIAQTMRKFELRTAAGELMREIPIAAITAELGTPIITIHRNELIDAMHAAAGDTPIHYDARATGYAVRADGGVEVRFADGRSTVGDLLIGADGIRSVVRARLQGERPPTEYGYLCWLAIIPFRHARITEGYAGHYWGPGQRFGLIDIGGGRAYWWGTKNMPATQARDWRGGKDDILAAFAGWAPEVRQAIRETDEAAIVAVPAQDRPFSTHWGTGPVTLVGDAAHPMLTSLSQGAGSAIEDGYVLARSLAVRLASGGDVAAGLRDYEKARIPRTRALVAGSRRLSMTEQLADPVACAARNLLLKYVPTTVLQRVNMEPMRFTVEPMPAPEQVN